MAKKKRGLFGKCYLCPENNSPRFLEEHHIVMQAAGGRDLPTVDICSDCHDNLHKQALNILSNSRTKKVAYFAPAEMEKAKPFIQALVIAIRKNRENPDASVPVQLMIKVPRGFRDALHLAKTDAGHKNLEYFITTILARYLQIKGVNVDKDFNIVS